MLLLAVPVRTVNHDPLPQPGLGQFTRHVGNGLGVVIRSFIRSPQNDVGGVVALCYTGQCMKVMEDVLDVRWFRQWRSGPAWLRRGRRVSPGRRE